MGEGGLLSLAGIGRLGRRLCALPGYGASISSCFRPNLDASPACRESFIIVHAVNAMANIVGGPNTTAMKANPASVRTFSTAHRCSGTSRITAAPIPVREVRGTMAKAARLARPYFPFSMDRRIAFVGSMAGPFLPVFFSSSKSETQYNLLCTGFSCRGFGCRGVGRCMPIRWISRLLAVLGQPAWC